MKSEKLSVFKKYKKILIYADMDQNEDVTKHFLSWISRVDFEEFIIEYYFSFGNIDSGVLNLINLFSENHKVKLKDYSEYIRDNNYGKDDIKNDVINYMINNEYDYLFFSQSNILYHPLTLRQLIHCNKDIVGNIFWQKSTEDYRKPNVWMSGDSNLYNFDISESEFFDFLNNNKLVSVGGIAGSVLVSNRALIKGVSFKEVYNVTYAKDYNAFSIRAKVLGFDIYLDSTYPSYFIFDDNDLKVIENLASKVK